MHVYGETVMASPLRNARNWKIATSLVAVLGLCLAIRHFTGTQVAEAQAPPTRPAASGDAKPLARPGRPQHDVMAIVNGQDISRRDLANACVERYGEDVLEAMVNKKLILHHCNKRNIGVTNEEIEAEIDRMAKRFRLGREQWLELLEKERGVSVAEYKRDIVWPTLALRKLAAGDLQVTAEEIEAQYELRHGAAVQARLIVVDDAEQAAKIHRQVAAQPADFARIAMAESVDVNSASIGGLIQPIRRHMGDANIEAAVFALQPGQVTPVIPVANQFAILKCEGVIPARNVPLASVQDEIIESIREEKLRSVAGDLFTKLQNAAVIKNVYNDPQLNKQMPGVVATVNGEQITMQQLGQEALLRHGEEVLEIEIAHKLLEQALQSSNVTVTQQDLDAEIAHAARLAGAVDNAGNPKVEQWVKQATEEQDVSYAMYVRDSVWPSAALKKLTGGNVQVSADDVQKGFEANYGARVRCRAIVLGDLRMAQDVWAKARSNDSLEFFAQLATEYSIEPTSKALQGEVPPIRKNGGQPQLEEVAFKLQPGEMSGIVQVGDKFVILKCEGLTEPVDVAVDEVANILKQDIFEKKIRLAMSERFEQIRQNARIDNYLTGTTQAPPRQAEAPKRDTGVRPASATR
jgi:parvulin-like peptidyl-prolyl isomerase